MASKDYEQGEDYEEYEDLDEDAEEYDEDDDVETVYDTIYGVPKKVVYVGVAVVIVVIIAIFVFVSWGGDEEVEEEPAFVDETVWVDEPAEVVQEPVEDVQEEIPVDDTFVYDIEDLTSFEIKDLRSYGYTGDEIEYSISHGFDTDAMIERAKAELDEVNRESWERTSDAASDEYKYLMSMTYLGQPDSDEVIDQSQVEFLDRITLSTDVTINCDYEKCPMKGMQLYLKCKVANDTYYWYPVTPDRWVTLPDKGNIVLRITFEQYGIGTFITNAVETDSTLDTIDSSNDIDDVTDGTAVAEEASESEPENTFLTE